MATRADVFPRIRTANAMRAQLPSPDEQPDARCADARTKPKQRKPAARRPESKKPRIAAELFQWRMVAMGGEEA